jgi:hypothetical protein
VAIAGFAGLPWPTSSHPISECIFSKLIRMTGLLRLLLAPLALPGSSWLPLAPPLLADPGMMHFKPAVIIRYGMDTQLWVLGGLTISVRHGTILHCLGGTFEAFRWEPVFGGPGTSPTNTPRWNIFGQGQALCAASNLLRFATVASVAAAGSIPTTTFQTILREPVRTLLQNV